MSAQHRAFQQAHSANDSLVSLQPHLSAQEAPHLLHHHHQEPSQQQTPIDEHQADSFAPEQLHASAATASASHHNQQSYLLSSQEVASAAAAATAAAVTSASQLQQVDSTSTSYASQAPRPHTQLAASFSSEPAPSLSAPPASIEQPFLNYALLDSQVSSAHAHLATLDGLNAQLPAAKAPSESGLPTGASDISQAAHVSLASVHSTLSPSVSHYAQPMGVNHLLTFAEPAAEGAPVLAHAHHHHHHQYGLHSGATPGYGPLTSAASAIGLASSQTALGAPSSSLQLHGRAQAAAAAAAVVASTGGANPAGQPSANPNGPIHLSKIDDYQPPSMRLGHQAGPIIVLAHAGSNR